MLQASTTLVTSAAERIRSCIGVDMCLLLLDVHGILLAVGASSHVQKTAVLLLQLLPAACPPMPLPLRPLPGSQR